LDRLTKWRRRCAVQSPGTRPSSWLVRSEVACAAPVVSPSGNLPKRSCQMPWRDLRRLGRRGYGSAIRACRDRRESGSGLFAIKIAAAASGPHRQGDLFRPPSEARQALASVRRANCDAEFGPTAQTMTIVALLRDPPIAFRASSADAGAALRLLSLGFEFYGRTTLAPSLAITDVMSDEPITPHDVFEPSLLHLEPFTGHVVEHVRYPECPRHGTRAASHCKMRTRPCRIHPRRRLWDLAMGAAG